MPPIVAVPTTSLLDDPKSRGAPAGDVPQHAYGAFVPVVDEFLPLGGGGKDDLEWSMADEEIDPNRPSATSLIYLCALCSSLTSVLLGYGEDGQGRAGGCGVWCVCVLGLSLVWL